MSNHNLVVAKIEKLNELQNNQTQANLVDFENDEGAGLNCKNHKVFQKYLLNAILYSKVLLIRCLYENRGFYLFIAEIFEIYSIFVLKYIRDSCHLPYLYSNLSISSIMHINFYREREFFFRNKKVLHK